MLIRFYLPTTLRTERINALTGLRAIAASMVFLYHYRKFFRDDIPGVALNFVNEFHTGVSIFFVLSGFLIAYTYGDKPARSSKDYFKYLLVRLFRIFPIYLIILTAKYFDQGFPNTQESILTYSLSHGFADRLNLSGVSQAWTLTVELTFYTLAPALYFVMRKNILKTILILTGLLILTLTIGYVWHYINGNPQRFFYPWFFVFNTTFIGRFPEFLSGILLAHFITNSKEIQFPKRYYTLIGSALTLACIYLISLFEKDIYSHGTDHPVGLAIRNLVFPFCVFILLYGLIKERTWFQRLLGSRGFVLLGNASFVFYLIHIGYISMQITKWHFFPDRNFILLWGISIGIYLLVEKPIYEMLKKWVRKEKKEMPKGEEMAVELVVNNRHR